MYLKTAVLSSWRWKKNHHLHKAICIHQESSIYSAHNKHLVIIPLPHWEDITKTIHYQILLYAGQITIIWYSLGHRTINLYKEMFQ